MLGTVRVRGIATGAILGMLSVLTVSGCEARGKAPVYASAEDVQPLAVGERVPPARVVTVRGEPVDLADVVREHGALLVFYRGGW
jgi:hypothetical protein